MAVPLDKEVKKSSHLGHAVATLRINCGKRYGFGYGTLFQYRDELSFANRICNDQIRKPHNAAMRDREP